MKYNDEEVRLVPRKYANGRLAIEMISEEDGLRVLMVTVNLPESPLQHGEIHVKDWAENQNLPQWLVRMGIARWTGKTAYAGFGRPPVMILTDDWLKRFSSENLAW